MGWLWYLGTLVPVIGLVQVGDQAWADRYTYLPLIGLFVAVVWLACEIIKSRLVLQSCVCDCGRCLDSGDFGATGLLEEHPHVV